jgi:haloalkane dehalogenase
MPFASHFATVEGSRMHYLDEGQGDPILFLHGNPTSSYLWRNIFPPLIPLARCIAPDLIGMGKSDKPPIAYGFFDHVKYLEGLIKQLGLRNITLVVHDWGSALGFHYAMRHSKNVKAIAFLEAMLKPYHKWEDFPAALRDQFKAFRTADTGLELIALQNVFIEQLVPRSVIRPLSEEEMNAYRAPFLDPSSRKPIWRFTHELPIEECPRDVNQAVAEYSRKLQESRLPKLLFTATPGAIISEPEIQWCKTHLKNLSIVDLGPGIHFHQEDNPVKLGAELAKWYRRLQQLPPC